jgi:hypothetical protein
LLVVAGENTESSQTLVVSISDSQRASAIFCACTTPLLRVAGLRMAGGQANLLHCELWGRVSPPSMRAVLRPPTRSA